MSNSDSPTEEKRRSWIFVLLILLLVCGCVTLVAGPGRPLVLGFLSGGSEPTATPTAEPPTPTPTPPKTCGDGRCDARAQEDCATCSKDCGECQPTCGDDVCDKEAGEDCTTCSKDCGECQPTCGDGVCSRDAGENCKICEKDCGVCPNPRGACLDPCDPDNPTCQAGLACVPGATSSSSQYICWSQTICDATPVPTCNNDDICGPGETANCPDCRPCVCGDGVCEQARCNELQQNCPADCGSGQPTCVCVCTDPCFPTASCRKCVDSCTGATCRP